MPLFGSSVKDYDSSIQLGSGYDNLSEKTRGLSVEGQREEDIIDEKKIWFHLVESNSELANYMEISASAYFNASLGSGSAKAKFISQQRVNRYSVYLMVKVLVQNEVVRLNDIKLNDEALKCLENEGSEEFRKRYGDEFVIALIKGGEFWALVEVKTKDEEDRGKITSFLKGELNSKNLVGDKNLAEGTADFEQAMNDFQKNYGKYINVTSFESGGDSNSSFSNPNDFLSLINYVTLFPSRVSENNTCIQVHLNDYNILAKPENCQFKKVTKAKSKLQKLLKYNTNLLDYYNDIQYIIKNPTLFESVSIHKLNEESDQVQDEFDLIREQVITLLDNPDSYEKIVVSRRPKMDLPPRMRRKTRPSPPKLTNPPGLWGSILDKVLGIDPKQVPCMTYDSVIEILKEKRSKDSRVKQGKVLRQINQKDPTLTHLVLMFLDEFDQPLSNKDGMSYTREFLAESIDDFLEDALEEANNVLTFKFKEN